jgi:glutamyl-tRNA reductase
VAVVVLGLNYRTVPLPVLESMTVAPSRLAKAIHDLASQERLDEVVVLSTCMRTEIYATASRFHPAMNDLRNCLSTWSGHPPEDFSDGLYSYYDEAATSHLFSVAAGVDSAVIGEGEILSQVRRAWEAARAEHATGPVLDVLFRHAVEAGKRARAETAIARGTLSLAHSAVELAAAAMARHSGAGSGAAGSVDDGLAGRSMLVVGAGEMAGSTARAWASLPNRGRLEVVNRTPERAEALAADYDGVAVPWSELRSAVARADVVITSTGAEGLLLEAGDVAAIMAERPERPMLVVDIAVPHDVDPGVRSVPGVTLLDMGDLKSFAEVAAADRRRELPKVARIVAEEVARYHEVAAQREVAPLVAALRARAEEIRLGELARLGNRLGSLDERQLRAVDTLTKGIVAKLLHEPTVQVKAAAGSPRQEQLTQALRYLFDLDAQ